MDTCLAEPCEPSVEHWANPTNITSVTPKAHAHRSKGPRLLPLDGFSMSKYDLYRGMSVVNSLIRCAGVRAAGGGARRRRARQHRSSRKQQSETASERARARGTESVCLSVRRISRKPPRARRRRHTSKAQAAAITRPWDAHDEAPPVSQHCIIL